MSERPISIIIKHYRLRYIRGNRRRKSELLDDFCQTYSYHRKAASRLLSRFEPDKYGKPGPGRRRKYEPAVVLEPLKQIWFATNYVCSKKLKAAIPLWLNHYETSFGELSSECKLQLLSISAATIDRLLKPAREKYLRPRLCGTKPGSILKNQIPIKTDHWDVTQPGFMEADTVAHCGSNMAGNFVWSLTLTDIYSGWTELRATWNKGAAGIVEQIKHIEEHLPFLLKGFDCDNGSEFLNYHLMRYLTERKSVIQFTRSRPYKKNDNAHVEQKNWTHVRQLIGYDRIEHQKLVPIMNDLYINEWSLLQNFFVPNMKLKEKTKINSRYYKKYDKPQTPYQRLMACDHITAKQKAQLKKTFLSLNPFELNQQIEQKLKIIFRHGKVTPFMRQRLTLAAQLR